MRIDVQLQKLKVRDAPAVVELAAGYFQEIAPDLHIDASLAMARHLGDAARRNWLIRADGETAGFAFTFPVVPDLWEIAEFCVLPEWRRRGVGRMALQQILCQQPGQWRLGLAQGSDLATAFWANSLGRISCVSQIKPGAPLMPTQSGSYSFFVSGGQSDD